MSSLRMPAAITLILLSLTFVARADEARKAAVVFMCPYGGAKSVVAASYFNRLAEQQSLPFVAVAVAAEEPYETVPPKVAEFLKADGFDVASFKPRRVTKTDLADAQRVISIDCDLAKLDAGDVAIERWDDVPKISEDLPGSVAAIRKHLEALAGELSRR